MCRLLQRSRDCSKESGAVWAYAQAAFAKKIIFFRNPAGARRETPGAQGFRVAAAPIQREGTDMQRYPRFTMCFSIGPSNRDRADAIALYQRAFGARKIAESAPPGGGDLHIMMEICGTEILIGPGSTPGTGFENALNCEIRFDREDAFFAAYHAIGQGARSRTLEGPYPWAERLGLVVDKYGIGWALYWNRPE